MTEALIEIEQKEREIVETLPEIIEELGGLKRAARWLGFHPNTLEGWLKGKGKGPSDEGLAALQKAGEILRERPWTIPERFRLPTDDHDRLQR